MNCPICKRPVQPGSQFEPFCRERCKLIDLGNWADERYRIEAPARPEDLPEEEEDRES